jgi:AmmeMemoRadiSam system protein A
MDLNPLTPEEKQILLRLARSSIERVVRRQALPDLLLEDYPPALHDLGASFVTLTRHGELRGCIGALAAYQPLVQDVCEHAAAAALEDYRFPPVRPAEVAQLEIEISRLTPPIPLLYQSAEELLEKLRPGIDGVTLRDGIRRATFLPQVWENLPDKREFLAHLCLKMGAPANLWERKLLEVEVYQVEEFHEQGGGH